MMKNKPVRVKRIFGILQGLLHNVHMASPGTNLQLRYHPELQPLILRNVEWTGNTIDSGSYGSVEEVKIPGALCAAKKIHDFLSKEDPNWLARKTADENIQKFVEECKIMGRLRHPNIVQFLGLWFSDDENSNLPALVMEKMLMSLHNLLEPDEKSLKTTSLCIPLGLKCSILQNIAQGIAFLHNQSPPVVHRDLSARNVLLNSAMVAKIADMGMARILPGHNALLTKAPGAQVYMPPEALDLEETSNYDISIDIFSLGILAIFVLSQEFPCKLKLHNYQDPAKGLVARTELQRRENYTKKIYSALPKTHPLVQMMEFCLENDPNARPRIDRVLGLLEQAVSEMQDSSHLQLNRLQLLQVVEQNTHILQQGKSVQRSVATRQSSSAELAQAERESAQMAELIRKQQLEYQEALQSLQKKAGLMDELQQENLKIHQLNLTLTGELEDYRNQTKTLLADLCHKEGDIAKLQWSGNHSNRSLETMKQKCDAWREEVEKLSPLRDEVARLHQENARLQQELAEATAEQQENQEMIDGLRDCIQQLRQENKERDIRERKRENQSLRNELQQKEEERQRLSRRLDLTNVQIQQALERRRQVEDKLQGEIHELRESLSSKTRLLGEKGNDQHWKESGEVSDKQSPVTNLAVLMCHSCEVLATKGDLTIYQLPTHNTMKKGDLIKCTVGQPLPQGCTPSKHKVLMLVGATGAGKSTLINGFANYVMGVEFSDPFRFKLVVDGNQRSQAHSQTKCITAYKFPQMEGSPLEYALTLIDTPGFGDTEGFKHLTQLRIIKQIFPILGVSIDGIGFVAQASLPRLTPTQKYIFDAILSIFGKDIGDNIFLLTTFADCETPPLLDTVKTAGVPYQDYYKFNNSALFVCKSSKFVEMFWAMGKGSFESFFQKFSCRVYS